MLVLAQVHLCHDDEISHTHDVIGSSYSYFLQLWFYCVGVEWPL